jgi:multisubunit Na+/H+ antiporter MnhB subunit
MKPIQSFLLQAVIGVVFLLVNIISIYLLLRGHNLPGGGFIGGLATGMSFILLGLVRGWLELQRELPLPPLRLASFGLLLAVGTGAAPLLVGKPFLTQYHFHLPALPLIGDLHIGTPLIFDIGVYLLVSCITIKLLIVLARSTYGFPAFTPGEAEYYSSAIEEPIEEEARQEERNRHAAD